MFICRSHSWRTICKMYPESLKVFLKSLVFAETPRQFEYWLDKTDIFVKRATSTSLSKKWKQFQRDWLKEDQFFFSLGQCPSSQIFSTSVSEAFQKHIKSYIRQRTGSLKLRGGVFVPSESTLTRLNLSSSLEALKDYHVDQFKRHKVMIMSYEADISSFKKIKCIFENSFKYHVFRTEKSIVSHDTIDYEFYISQIGNNNLIRTRPELTMVKILLKKEAIPKKIIRILCDCEFCSDGCLCPRIVKALYHYGNLTTSMDTSRFGNHFHFVATMSDYEKKTVIVKFIANLVYDSVYFIPMNHYENNACKSDSDSDHWPLPVERLIHQNILDNTADMMDNMINSNIRKTDECEDVRM